ncbi:MAG: hypothetical protein IH589_04900 [Anaerolineales bacterium]|nr:hypothetical protein [Anaerolineales bacterium]
MFRISFLEMAVICFIGLLILAIPAMVVWFYKTIDRRLKNIEKQMDKKDK